jgi:hypothetical protein
MAILDTGTMLALVLDVAANAIYVAIPGVTMDQQQGGWVYPSGAQGACSGFLSSTAESAGSAIVNSRDSNSRSVGELKIRYASTM